MTLDEAIQHAKEVAQNRVCGESCAKEHKQLADWLEELRTLKGKHDVYYK